MMETLAGRRRDVKSNTIKNQKWMNKKIKSEQVELMMNRLLISGRDVRLVKGSCGPGCDV